jgi:uncharacterized protein associated with vWA-MoxR-VMAP ternary system
MFTLDGELTFTSRIAQAILDNSGLPLDPASDDSLALVLYRKDPLDGYLYLTALAGIREPEPLFGWLDLRNYQQRLDRHAHAQGELGFRRREGTFLIETVESPSWQLYVNGRSQVAEGIYRAKRDNLLKTLANVLDEAAQKGTPLYPDLWYQERLARDKLRSSAHVLAPGTSLETFARHLTVDLRDMLVGWLPDPSVRVGVYLDTGKMWSLCGLSQLAPWLPDHIDGGTTTGKPNAFNWVRSSLSPVLVRQPISAPWTERLTQCGVDLANAISDPSFSGMCIVPISHNLQPWRCMGIILATAFCPPLRPAHLYLLNRLALGVSGYLMPLLPIPGFRWMPDAKLGRGNAFVEEPPDGLTTSEEVPPDVVRRAARDLLPSEAKAKITTLRAGQSGAVVFRLSVWDQKKVAEVPRVLKVGPASIIEQELRAYYRYAHNKKVGGASRVDIAREFQLSPSYPPPQEHMYGAILYTLVGAGDKAVPWSQWAKDANTTEIEYGLEMLNEQLSCWYDRRMNAQTTIVDLMLKPLVSERWESSLNGNVTTKPCFKEVKDKLLELWTTLPSKDCVTSVVHGDLHTDNIFAILSPNKAIRGVALIDWGMVRSGWHPLSDISRLMVDLVYRVSPHTVQREWAFDQVRKWGVKLGCHDEDWRVALIHQIAKIMFYRYGTNDLMPYIEDTARLQAWHDLLRLADELGQL